jgi:hypothetical protein
MIIQSKSCSYISVALAMLCSAPGLELRLDMTLVSMLISRVNSRHDFEHDLRVSSRVEFRGELRGDFRGELRGATRGEFRGETSCLESHTCVYSSSKTIYPTGAFREHVVFYREHVVNRNFRYFPIKTTRSLRRTSLRFTRYYYIVLTMLKPISYLK